jgi:hypothetical protein
VAILLPYGWPVDADVSLIGGQDGLKLLSARWRLAGGMRT